MPANRLGLATPAGIDLRQVNLIAAGAGVDEGIEQHRRCHGLDQETVEQRRLGGAALRQHLTAMRGDHQDHGRRARQLQFADAQAGLPAVQAGHLPVDEHRMAS